MNIYLIESPREVDYDTYSKAIVVARSPLLAKKMHPDGESTWQAVPDYQDEDVKNCWINKQGYTDHGSWVPPDEVKLTMIGTTARGVRAGVVCASFHAG